MKLKQLNNALVASLVDEGLSRQRVRTLSAEFGKAFRQARSERFGLREAARQLGVGAPHLSDLERGNRRWTELLAAKAVELLSHE